MKIFKNDNMLKLVSLIIAIGLWIYVVQVQNPEREKTFKNVPVVFTQKSALEEKDLIILNDKERTVDLTIRGNMKNIMNMSSTDVTVVADLGSIEDKGSLSLVTNVVLPYGNLEVVSKNPSTIQVEVDNLITKTFKIDVVPTGIPKENFAVGETTASPKEISVTGPKTILDGISSVVAEVDINGKDSDTVAVTYPKVFDSNQKEINASHIKYDIEEIQVRCEMLKTKTVDLIPVLSSDLRTENFYYQPDKNALSTINIKGPTAVVDKLYSVKTMPISLNDINESGDAEVTLNLPEGVTSTDGETFVIRFNKNAYYEQKKNDD